MKGKKCFGVLLALFIIFGVWLGVCSEDTNAASVTSNVYSSAHYSKNFDPQKIHYNVGPTTTPLYVLAENNVTGLWDYVQAISFPNPFTNKTGTGFSSSVYFTMHSTTGNFLNLNLKSLMANSHLGFEGIDENKPYCTQTWRATYLDSSTVQFLLESSCPAGSFPDGTNFNQVEASINFTPDSIFWCANDNPSQLCPTGTFGVTLYNIDYYFKLITSQSDSYNQTIISQNQIIINQNQEALNRDSQDRQDMQNASDNAQSGANSAQNQAQATGTTLLRAFTDFVNAVTTASASNCIIDADMGNLDLGEIDLCQLPLPTPFQVLASLTVIGFCVPLSIATAKKLIALIRSFQ